MQSLAVQRLFRSRPHLDAEQPPILRSRIDLSRTERALGADGERHPSRVRGYSERHVASLILSHIQIDMSLADVESDSAADRQDRFDRHKRRSERRVAAEASRVPPVPPSADNAASAATVNAPPPNASQSRDNGGSTARRTGPLSGQATIEMDEGRR